MATYSMFAGYVAGTDAKFVLDMTATLPLLFGAAQRNKKFGGMWYRAIAFTDHEAAMKFRAIGWEWRVLCTENGVVWMTQNDHSPYGYVEPSPDLLNA